MLLTDCPQASSSSPPAAFHHEINYQVGIAQGYDSNGRIHTGWGGRYQLIERLGPYLALGPEISLHTEAGTGTVRSIFDSNDYIRFPSSLFQVGLAGRVGVQLGAVRPSLLGGAGWYGGNVSFWGYSVGAELEVRSATWMPLLAFELRYHHYFLNRSDSANPHQTYATAGLSLRQLW